MSLAEKVVLIRILDHARYGASQCTASTHTLSRETGVTERYVRDVLTELERLGYVVIDRGKNLRITIGPCLCQIGTEFRVRLSPGTEFRECGTESHRAGGAHPYNGDFKSEEKNGFSPDDEKIHPQTQRWFGHLLKQEVLR